MGVSWKDGRRRGGMCMAWHASGGLPRRASGRRAPRQAREDGAAAAGYSAFIALIRRSRGIVDVSVAVARDGNGAWQRPEGETLW
jgi:hypothetical protein